MIAFIAIGRAPDHVAHAVGQARAADRDAAIVLLADRAPSTVRRAAAAAHVDVIAIDALRRDERLTAFYRRSDGRRRFRGGFWQHTTGRFFVLRAFMDRERLEAITHLEHDVLLYAPERVIQGAACGREPSMATVFESADRAIPALVHVAARSALDTFVDDVLLETEDQRRHATDMQRFAIARRRHPGLVRDLPTQPPSDADAAAVTTRSLFDDRPLPLPADGPAWLFDGARFGQYLGGIDPRNERGRLARWLRRQHGTLAQPNGFVNEACIDDPSGYRYGVGDVMGLPTPIVVAGSRTYPLATLHVHSKKLDRFVSGALRAGLAGTASPC